jgi:hypothetical protein
VKAALSFLFVTCDCYVYYIPPSFQFCLQWHFCQYSHRWWKTPAGLSLRPSKVPPAFASSADSNLCLFKRAFPFLGRGSNLQGLDPERKEIVEAELHLFLVWYSVPREAGWFCAVLGWNCKFSDIQRRRHLWQTAISGAFQSFVYGPSGCLENWQCPLYELLPAFPSAVHPPGLLALFETPKAFAAWSLFP